MLLPAPAFVAHASTDLNRAPGLGGCCCCSNEVGEGGVVKAYVRRRRFWVCCIGTRKSGFDTGRVAGGRQSARALAFRNLGADKQRRWFGDIANAPKPSPELAVFRSFVATGDDVRALGHFCIGSRCG